MTVNEAVEELRLAMHRAAWQAVEARQRHGDDSEEYRIAQTVTNEMRETWLAGIRARFDGTS